MKTIQNLRIEKMAFGGYGIGYHEAKAIFVPYTMIGDLADIRLTHEKKKHAFGRIITLHEREDKEHCASCSAFGTEIPCGACDWLHIPMQKQLEYKRNLVAELFDEYHLGDRVYFTRDQDENPHQRNKVYMPVDKSGYGFYARYSHQIVPHESCENQPELINEIARYLMELCQKAGVEPYDEITHTGTLRHIGFRRDEISSQILVILVCKSGRLPFSKTIVRSLTSRFPMIRGVIQNINPDKGNVILGEREKILFKDDYLIESLAGYEFRVQYRSFWQTNHPALKMIVSDLSALLDENAPETGILVDAYCGIGSLGICLAKYYERVIGIETAPQAVADARYNATQNGVENLSFWEGKSEELLPDILAKNEVNTLLLDPPRGGVLPELIQSILEHKVPRILYLSCSPMHLKRDADRLTNSGEYRLQWLRPYNMFPNTSHIECLALFELEK